MDMGRRYAHAACLTRRLRIEISYPDPPPPEEVGDWAAAAVEEGRRSFKEVYDAAFGIVVISNSTVENDWDDEDEDEDVVLDVDAEDDNVAVVVERLSFEGIKTDVAVELRRWRVVVGFGERMVSIQ